MCGIDKVIQDELPAGYNSTVGERGVQLSGGQRQRIGIARSLYRKAEILVFDEATSSLDSATEEKIVESIRHLSQNITVIMISHSMRTLRICDRVIRLEGGRIVHDGTYPEVVAHYEATR